MPGQRLPMRKIRDLLRLRAAGIGLSWPPPEDLSDAALERLVQTHSLAFRSMFNGGKMRPVLSVATR
jgi:hypothetical protein